MNHDRIPLITLCLAFIGCATIDNVAPNTTCANPSNDPERSWVDHGYARMRVMGGTEEIVSKMHHATRFAALHGESSIDDILIEGLRLPLTLIGDTLTLPFTVQETKRRAIEGPWNGR